MGKSEITEKRKAYMKEYNHRPDVKAKRSARQKQPDVIARVRAYRERPDIKAKYSERKREYGQRPEVKMKREKYLREYNKRPGVRDRRREYMRKYSRQYAQWKKAKKQQGNITDLTEKDFSELMGNPCSYCGETDRMKIGIDRVDCSKEYTADNCISCCGKCNWMKLDNTLDEWIEHMQKILNFLGYKFAMDDAP